MRVNATYARRVSVRPTPLQLNLLAHTDALPALSRETHSRSINRGFLESE